MTIGARVYYHPRVRVLSGSRYVGTLHWQEGDVLVCIAESGERVVVSASHVTTSTPKE